MAANAQGPAWSSDWLGLFVAKLMSSSPYLIACPMDVPVTTLRRCPSAQASVCGRSQLTPAGAFNTRAHLPRCSKLSHHNTSLTRCHYCWHSAKRSRGRQPCERQSTFFWLLQRYRLQPFGRQRKPVMAVRSQLGCSVDWLPEQSLGLLPLHHVTGHRLQCMSAAIGPTAVHIGTETVGSIRASACASKCPKLILRPFHPLRLLGDICRYRFASSPIRSFAADRHLCHFANNNDTTTLAAVADALVYSLRVAGVSPLSVTVWARTVLLALFMAIRCTL